MPPKRFILITAVAEVGSSTWRLLRAPADGPTNVYAGFPGYETGRLACWLPVALLGALLLAWLNRRFAFAQKSRVIRDVAIASTIGLAVELITSIFYWSTPYSAGVRGMYQGIWYWHRIPRQSDYGWLSLEGYVIDHLIPWVVCFGVLALTTYLWAKGCAAKAIE